jgi:hypothetical protein
VRRLAFVVLLIAICLPGLLGANAWLENSDVDRYVEMARGEVGEIPFRYRPTVPWLASLLAFPAVTSLRLVSLACTLGAYLCVDRIVSLLGGNRTRAGWLFAAAFPTAAYGASGYIDAAVLLVLAAGTWAVLTRSWRAFAAILVVGAGVSEKTGILLLVAAAQDRRALAFVGLFAVAQFAARGTSTFGWWPDKEMLRANLTPGRWFRVALSFGVPALLAVKARNVPRPLLAGLAGVVGLLVYGTLAARVDGRFAWLASAFTVPMALIPRRK